MTPSGSDLALLRLGDVLKQVGYRHITVTPATHARVNTRTENAWAKDLTGVFGWSRPFRVGTVPVHVFELMRQAGIAAPYQDGWRSTLRVSNLNDRLYFHSAWPTEAADAVFFGPDTYRYTAAVSQHFSLDQPSVRRAVDIGCGSGAGAIELALRLPDAEVLAVDINDAALRLARINAALASAPIQTRHSNLLAEVDGQFDLITANPPYLLDPAARSYRHGRGPLGAGLSLDIIKTALQRLNPGGRLLLYTGSAIVEGKDLFHLAAAQQLKSQCAWSYREIDPDVFSEELESGAYASADRIAAVWLCATMPATSTNEEGAPC
ncbi:MAG: class I SAM-dependent methyltransferase [Pigmentiphaga sp.]|nr:class I SAM-dependent methyltransferase [Pigmentiphaga sp.]